MKFSNALDQIGNERAMLRIGSAREISLRFVQENVCIFFRLDLEIDQFAPDFDVIRLRIGFCTEYGDFAVNGHDSFRDQVFGCTARSDPGLGD